jgi:DNA-binding CsgD family transcriptional regulator
LESGPALETQLLGLLESIYDSALHPDQAPLALRALNRALRGELAQVLTLDHESGSVLHSWVSDEHPRWQQLHDDYLGRWAARDPRTAWLASLPSGAVVRCREELGDAFVRTSNFYQQHLIPGGLRWTLAGVLERGAGSSRVIMHLRCPEAPPFEDDAAAALGRVLPHLHKAHMIRSRMERQEAGGSPAVEILRALPIPCLFTDHAGRVLERNPAFEEAQEALALRISVGRLRFSDAQDQSTWEATLADTHATAVDHAFDVAGADGKPWRIHLIALRAPLAGAAEQARKMTLVVFECRAPESLPSVDTLAPGARLTRAELEVATSVLQGLPAKVIARQRGASVNTVRSQIMAILDKTGFKSQRELMAAAGNSTLGAGTPAAGGAFRRSIQPDS